MIGVHRPGGKLTALEILDLRQVDADYRLVQPAVPGGCVKCHAGRNCTDGLNGRIRFRHLAEQSWGVAGVHALNQAADAALLPKADAA